MNVKHLLLRKTDVLKTSIFSERILKKCTSFEGQQGRRYIRGKFILALSSSAVFCLQICVSEFL